MKWFALYLVGFFASYVVFAVRQARYHRRHWPRLEGEWEWGLEQGLFPALVWPIALPFVAIAFVVQVGVLHVAKRIDSLLTDSHSERAA